MRTLACHGGKPIIQRPIKFRNTLSENTKNQLTQHLAHLKGWDLSGYLAGSHRGGGAVQRLESIFSTKFGCTHSIAVNSCTSALLVALKVLKPRRVHVPVMGMTAAAAVPFFLGMDVIFHDVDDHYCIKLTHDAVKKGDVILAVNLFGHPAELRTLRECADAAGAYLVEDNAQGFNATEFSIPTGTIGHIGCWSGNVHKPWNVGELGMITTNEDHLEYRLRGLMNHGEVAGFQSGLNLRPTELTALMAILQMDKADEVVESCRHIHYALADLCMGETFLIPLAREGCVSACYCLPISVPPAALVFSTNALRAEGLPCRATYVRIDKVYHDKGKYENADNLDSSLLLVELCSIDPDDEQITWISEALASIAEEVDRDRRLQKNKKIKRRISV